MSWFLLALLAPLAWSIANYLDKYLLAGSNDEAEGGSGGLLILSSLITLIIALVVLFVKGTSILHLESQVVGVLILSGIFEALYILFYFWALEKESATTVISLFQFAPIMGLIFGYLMLKEIPSLMQLFAVVVILVGSLLIVSKKGERFSLNGNILLLMVVSTAFVGLYNTLFKLVAETTPFWTAIFWQYLGIGMLGFILFVTIPPYRKQTMFMLFKRSAKVIFFTGFAEIMNVVALIATNAAILLAPVALVLSVSSVQPIFVLLEGLLLASLFPKLLNSSERPSLTFRYVLGIILVSIGGAIIYI